MRRVFALLLTAAAVASMLFVESPGGVVEAQLLIVALFLAV